MKVDGTHYRSLWWDAETDALQIIDQRWLPHEFRTQSVATLQDFADAIIQMRVRGAPLIGATAAYGMALAMRIDPSDAHMTQAWEILHNTRPTAINLRWALNRCQAVLLPLPEVDRAGAALALAHDIANEDVEINRQIGLNGLKLIQDIAAKKPSGEPVRLLTH
jgi:methylthioribose-1-phosphate isomerase